MNELYRYLTIAVTPEWRRLPEPVRRAHKRELAEVVSASDVRVHAYSLVGTRSDAELLLWAVDEDFERLRALEVRLPPTARRGPRPPPRPGPGRAQNPVILISCMSEVESIVRLTGWRWLP